MEGVGFAKRNCRKSRGFPPPRRSEAGYVLIWVLILTLVAGLIIGPFLLFMLTGLRASYSYADTMAEFYAADSGIEDALYKIINKDANLPENTGDSWPYTITDNVNGKQVDVTIESLWTLAGLESDHGGTMPHSELMVVGQMLDTPATVLSAGGIDDVVTTIPVSSTALFPLASPEDPSVIRIENELIQYTGKTDTEFTGCNRGYGGTAASYPQGTAVTSEEVIYRIDITDEAPGTRKINRVGAWLPAGFSYVPGSSNVATTLRLGIGDSVDEIPVESIEFFPAVDAANPGVVAIEHELIQYTGTQGGANPKLTGCTRGFNGTAKAPHSKDVAVSAEPKQSGYHGGTTLIWDMNNVPFEDLPTALPPGGTGGFTPGAEIPVKRTITFSFTPARPPKGIFAWIRINSMDIFLSWDTSGGIYKVTSTATDTSTGTHTTVESYVGSSRLTGRVSDVQGDARAIGNSLMKDLSGEIEIRETLLAQSSADVSDIPGDASVEAAYLYWSGWKLSPAYDADDIEGLADLVDEATFNGTAITADRVQLLRNMYGWSYSCFKDVTDYLEPPQSATITLNPTATTESATITNLHSSRDLDLQISVLSGPDGGYVTVGATTIMVGDYEYIEIDDYLNSVQLTSGDVAGPPDYVVRVEVRNRYADRLDHGDVDGTEIGGYSQSLPESTEVTLQSTQSIPEATITKISSESAKVDITNVTPNDPPDSDNNITVDGDTVVPGATKLDIEIIGAPHNISGTAYQAYEVTVTCTKGIVVIAYDSSSVILGAPGTVMTNGTYTVGDVEATAGVEGGGSQYEWAYAGWSLIIIYSDPDPDAEAHQFYLYDNFLYADLPSWPATSTIHTFTITGFLAPSDSEGKITCFVGEGDYHYKWDRIQFKGQQDSSWHYLSDPTDDDDGDDTNNVWNGKSSGLGGLSIDGVDIDTFDVSSLITPNDTSAQIELETTIEIWNLVYLFLSFRSDLPPESGQTPVGIITYGSGG